MNFYTVAARMRKAVKKEVDRARDTATHLHGYDTEEYRNYVDMVRRTATDIQMHEFEQTMELGLQLMETFKERVAERAVAAGERAMMLTVRPPDGTNWVTFKRNTEEFVTKWQDGWHWYEYAFEQKGETKENMGHGFHVHLIFATSKKNYYKSHVLRDAQRAWTYVAANCIQVDVIKNLARARQYIRGDKGDEAKARAVAFNEHWRARMNIPQLLAGGQVQPPALITVT